MRVEVNLSALNKTRWYEYAVRFAFGGAMTVATGLIAQHFGYNFGGIFLAFPAIFPASVTLVEKHEREKKRRAGIDKAARGRKLAAMDARGAMLGSVALAAFGLSAWKLFPLMDGIIALFVALASWLGVALAIWSLHHFGYFRFCRWRPSSAGRATMRG